MRRIPGLIAVGASRPAGEIAAEISTIVEGGPFLRRARARDAEAVFEVQRAASLAALGHIYPPDRFPYPDAEVRAHWRDALARG